MNRTPTHAHARGREKWLAYSSMAGAFLAMAGDADAQIIYTDVDPDQVVFNDFFGIDFDGDSNEDVRFWHIASTTTYGFTIRIAEVNNAGGGSVVGSYSGGLYPLVLPPGTPVGPATLNWHPIDVISGLLGSAFGGATYAIGNWVGQSGFVGLRFVVGSDLHYAWVELEVTPGVNSVIIKGYAWQSTPNTALAAGATGSTLVGSHAGAPLSFNVFPNPVRDNARVSFRLPDAGTCELRVLDGIGRIRSTQSLAASQGEQKVDMDLSSLEDGVYFIELRSGDRVRHQKIIKGN